MPDDRIFNVSNNHCKGLICDPNQIAKFYNALFRYADPNTYVSLRAFAGFRPWGRWCSLAAGDPRVLDAAVALADAAANASEPVVFCPPIATFHNTRRAREIDLANGLCVSADCDQRPGQARAALETRFGPPTVVVASGGEWIDPETGEIQPKLHLHWRLAIPTRTKEEHNALKRVRGAMARTVIADHSSTPMVHPLRWPGSWHTKATPRMATIISCDPDWEIKLGDALDAIVDVDVNIGLTANAVGARYECTELSPYGRAALISAAEHILQARNGEQELTLNREGYTIGQLVAAGGVPERIALEVLEEAANRIISYKRPPWRPGQAVAKVRRAFRAGLGRPRRTLGDLEREMDRMMVEDDHGVI
jgi:hypothetical protein